MLEERVQIAYGVRANSKDVPRPGTLLFFVLCPVRCEQSHSPRRNTTFILSTPRENEKQKENVIVICDFARACKNPCFKRIWIKNIPKDDIPYKYIFSSLEYDMQIVLLQKPAPFHHSLIFMDSNSDSSIVPALSCCCSPFFFFFFFCFFSCSHFFLLFFHGLVMGINYAGADYRAAGGKR